MQYNQYLSVGYKKALKRAKVERIITDIILIAVIVLAYSWGSRG